MDLDGTLVDSNYLHTISWARGFAEAGYRVTTADIHRAIGMGSDLLPAFILGHDAPEVAEARRPHWQALRGEVRALPGAPELLAELHGRGLAVVLATSSDPADLEVLLGAVGADPSTIDHITSGGDVAVSKPEPNVFAVAMAGAALDPTRSIAIGDTIWDVESATRCGLACLGVATGGISPNDLLGAGAAAAYRGVAELRARLDDSPIALLAAG